MPIRPRPGRPESGFTLTELLGTLLVVVLLLATTLPAIGMGGARGDAGVQGSIANLVTISVAHVLYAADWNGRQVTWTRDDLGTADSISGYNSAQGCTSSFNQPPCHPPVLAGLGPTGGGGYGFWGFWGATPLIEPFIWPGGPNDGPVLRGFGNFRYPNLDPFHDYVNGRYQDEVFYAPNDELSQDRNSECFESLAEFDPACNPGYSSYCLSAAAMFHPDVMRANAAGGWQDPWSLDHGFQSPGLFQATYPQLKTHMLEALWLQNAPVQCNPDVPDFCSPYFFNQAAASSPVTLFYDGSVRLLPNTEVLAADQQIIEQTGGIDGAWHRDTPFGIDGFFIQDGFDLAPISHHVLTTDGILGRDTVAGAGASAARRLRRGGTVPLARQATDAHGFSLLRTSLPEILLTTPEGNDE